MFSKKNKRKITVNNEVYYWTASGNGWINFYISLGLFAYTTYQTATDSKLSTANKVGRIIIDLMAGIATLITATALVGLGQ